MNEKMEFSVDKPGTRLDVFVSGKCGISRSYAQKLIAGGHITANDRLAKASQKLDIGDKISATIPEPTPLSLEPESIPIKVIYENDDLLVVDKPAGLTVHPAPGHWTHTLVNAVLAYCPELGGISGTLRPGIVHRLDKDTSGLIVIAKNDVAQSSLSHQIKERSVTKRYLALVAGHLSPKQGAIDAAIGRDPRNRKRMAVVDGGRPARTRYKVIDYIGDCSYLEAVLETGRTHQIRVHFSAIGYPLFGDIVYGKKSPLLGHHFLHAYLLGFGLPGTGEYVEFQSELPLELQNVLEQIS